ncbi:hypothetical protein [Thermoflexus sp.]|uniref:thermonuclease family protein n=1 Tax=Thermoflexus sp. TaxID=1969742 RepID=UPI002ADE890D|nr:hypothetical protein [Thermoflexus sp.]
MCGKILRAISILLTLITALGAAAATRTPAQARRFSLTPTPAIRSDALCAIPGAECLPSGRLVESARLVRVIDGDTIEVRIGGRRAVVRYLGINAPERG